MVQLPRLLTKPISSQETALALMATLLSIPAPDPAQNGAPQQFFIDRTLPITPSVFRGLIFGLLLDGVIVATACASYVGWHRLLHR
jgi:hypothetical protein